MRQILVIFLLLMQYVSVIAQDNTIDIYVVSNKTLIAANITDSVGDTIYVQTADSLIIAFAKSDMQGLNFGETKEIKKLQRQLLRNETMKLFPNYPGYPGVYQINNGQISKGTLMHLIATAGIICITIGSFAFIISATAVLVAITSFSFNVSNFWIAILEGSMYILREGIVSFIPVFFWNGIDVYKTLQSKFKNRYYYTGEYLNIKNSKLLY